MDTVLSLSRQQEMEKVMLSLAMDKVRKLQKTRIAEKRLAAQFRRRIKKENKDLADQLTQERSLSKQMTIKLAEKTELVDQMTFLLAEKNASVSIAEKDADKKASIDCDCFWPFCKKCGPSCPCLC